MASLLHCFTESVMKKKGSFLKVPRVIVGEAVIPIKAKMHGRNTARFNVHSSFRGASALHVFASR